MARAAAAGVTAARNRLYGEYPVMGLQTWV
jgi:hypothetical protein